MPTKPRRAARLTLEDVAAVASGLPNATVGTRWNHRTWLVNERGFCWERPLGKADRARYGDAPLPEGDIIAVVVEDLDAKDVLLGIELPGFFTIPHFNGHPAVLIELRLARPSDVRAAIETAWRVTSARPVGKRRTPKAPGKAR